MSILAKAVLIFTLGLSGLSTLHAQDLPDAPRPGKLFVIESVAYTGTNIMDGLTTMRNQGWGSQFLEQPFPTGSAYMLGQRPSAVRYSLVMGGLQLATELVSYRLECSHRRFFRLLGHGLMVQGAASHLDGFINNEHQEKPAHDFHN